MLEKEFFYFRYHGTMKHIGNTNFPPLAGQRSPGVSCSHPPCPPAGGSTPSQAQTTPTQQSKGTCLMNDTLLALLAFTPLVLAGVLLIGLRMPARTAMPAVYVVTALIALDRKSTRLNSSHVRISYAVFCLKKKKNNSNKYVRDRNISLSSQVLTIHSDMLVQPSLSNRTLLPSHPNDLPPHHICESRAYPLL